MSGVRGLRRIPIAVRIFVAVLLTVMIVGMSSLWVLDRALREGFARYVAQVEMSRLDGLATQLEQQYQVLGHWPDMSQSEPMFWLMKQHFIAMHQERRLKLLAAGKTLSAEDDMPPMPPNFADRREREDRRDNRANGIPTDKPRKHFKRPPPDQLILGERLGLLSAEGKWLSGFAPDIHAPRRALTVNQQVVGYLTIQPQVNPDDALSQTYFSDQRRQIFWVSLTALLASVIAAGLLASHFNRPIRRLVDAARLMTQRRFDTRIQLGRSDELGDLGQAMNQLAQMLEQHEQSRQQWVADTSHELRTPVAVLQAQIEAMQDGVRQPTPEHLATMQRHVKQLGRLIGDLNALSQADAGQLLCTPISINPWRLLDRELESFADRFRTVGLTVERPAEPCDVRIMVDPDRLRQIVDNLFENSARYTDTGGHVALHDTVENGFWMLCVEDTAPSVPAELLPRLGERFFRADASRSRLSGGSGLGLALSRQLAEAQGGELLFSASPIGGVRACLRLPLAP